MDRTHVAIYARDGDAVGKALDGGAISTHVVHLVPDLGALLQTTQIHVILLDSEDERFDELFNYVHSRNPDLSIVVLLDNFDFDAGYRVLKMGAHDWIARSQLTQDISLVVKTLAMAHVKRATPDGKANSAFIRYLDDHFLVLRGSIDTINTDVGSLHSNLNTLQTDVGTLKGDVGVLQTEVVGVKQDIGQVRKGVEEHREWHVQHMPLPDTVKPVLEWLDKHRLAAVSFVLGFFVLLYVVAGPERFNQILNMLKVARDVTP